MPRPQRHRDYRRQCCRPLELPSAFAGYIAALVKVAEGKERSASGRWGRRTTGSSVPGTRRRHRQAAVAPTARTPELAGGLCLGGGSPLGTARRGAAQAAEAQAAQGGRRAGGRGGEALPARLQGPGEPEQGRFCRGLGCVNCRLKQRQTHRESAEHILFCNFRVEMLLQYKTQGSEAIKETTENLTT